MPNHKTHTRKKKNNSKKEKSHTKKDTKTIRHKQEKRTKNRQKKINMQTRKRKSHKQTKKPPTGKGRYSNCHDQDLRADWIVFLTGGKTRNFNITTR